MRKTLGRALRRHAVGVSVVVGAVAGACGGIAYAYNPQFQHTAGLWSHGINNAHVYMVRTDGGSSVGNVAPMWVDLNGIQHHGDESIYANNHVHTDGPDSTNGGCCDTYAGHFQSNGPSLSHHEHP